MYRITVIICTYNRAAILGETMNSWLGVRNTGLDVELLVVDNNSTDITPAVVETFRGNYHNPMHYLCETKIGLSNARNRGIREATGEIIAFVDDDVYFDANWLIEILKAFKENPDVACVGGKSFPRFEDPPPGWISKEMYKFYGSTNSGEKDRLMVFPEHPYGLNMAFRKWVFDQVGNFNPHLGRSKGSLLSNEELDMFRRVHKAGLKVFYASRAILHHRIPAERTDKSWIVERTYWQGISDAVYWQENHPRGKIYLAFKTLWISKTIFLFYLKRALGVILPKFRPCTFKERLAVYRLMGIARQNVFEIFNIRKK